MQGFLGLDKFWENFNKGEITLMPLGVVVGCAGKNTLQNL
jgi:hypothetical protein